MTGRPSFLFILVDCLRSRAVFDRSRGAKLPTISRLQKHGIAFPNCVATATTTSPSIATLFTGTLPFVHGIRQLHDDKLNPGIATLAEILRDHGYWTEAEVTGPVRTEKGLDRGFDVFNARNTRANLYEDRFWERLQDRMMGLPQDRPSFFYLHLWEMHRPRSVPAAFDRREYGRHPYERALSALDQLRLPRILELAGPDTVVILTGDHGEIPRFDSILITARRFKLKPLVHLTSKHSGHGDNVYEDQVLVPLLMVGPGVPAAVTSNTAIRHMDLFPTILELAGIADQRNNQTSGESLVPLFFGTGHDRPGYSEAIGPSQRAMPEDWIISIRSGGWKYVRRAVGSGARLWKLPNERRDVAKVHPRVVADLEAVLQSMQSGVALDATGQELTAEESTEIEEHLRELGYLD